MGLHQIIGGAVVAILMYWDWRYRVAPNWITLPAWALGIIHVGAPAFWMSLAVFTVMMVAKFPSGDCKGVAAIAAFMPWWGVVPALLITFVVTVVLMESRWYNLYQQAHRWPWLCGYGTALTISLACGTLFIR